MRENETKNCPIINNSKKMKAIKMSIITILSDLRSETHEIKILI